ncbi:ABC-three component system middle component 4 [Flavobacterium sp. SUN046]|uniref:ABC-three component system middle component 4 n=1 Tax=Flavobacterium sp. SUN046 TaxID=3002440 RepID=UPI002DBB326F|nr:ABC-three component system middle component 4 [Flavobacterium sp. SUN046]MEC4049323.1 ABC-three component system middle component 4 [Flavobacterium sp. SUN046]
MKLPFYIPDNELTLRIGKLLCLFQVLSTGVKKTINLDLPKIGQFEFLTKHPIVLNKILNEKDKKTIQLHNSEKYSIEALFLNRAEVFDLKKIKILLKILLSNKYIEAKVLSDNQIYYSITAEGLKQAETLQSEYFQRTRDLNHELKPLVSLPSSTISKLIESHLVHGKKN